MGIERPYQYQSMKIFDFNNYDNQEELIFTSFVITDNYEKIIKDLLIVEKLNLVITIIYFTGFNRQSNI